MNRLIPCLCMSLSACSAADEIGAFPEPTADAAPGPRSASSSTPSTAPVGAPAKVAAPGSALPRLPSPTLANDVSQHAALKAIASNHSSFFRADGSWWSLLDCRAPPPAPSRISDAEAESAHGRKLYTLQIADFDAYARETGAPGPADAPRGLPSAIPGVSQAVVKVSYEPTPDASARTAPFIAPVTKNGYRFYAGAPRDLFIMYRPTDANLATDEGWLYGTVAPSGEVTSAGKVATCMRCHADAPHGRLFGPRAAD